MSEVTVTEATANLDDGYQVYTKTWTATPEVARVLLLHGFSDHSNNYEDLLPYLASRGISCHAFDQRGWGRSVHEAKHKGLTGPTSDVMADVSCMLRPLLSATTTPVFLLGHSMGGAEVLYYAATDPAGLLSRVRGVIALAPLIALHAATRPSALTVAAGRAAGRLLPRRQLVNKLDASALSRVPQRNRDWAADPLCHDTGTLAGLAGMLDRGAALERGDARLGAGRMQGARSRVLVAHGSADRINDVGGSREWVARACDAEDKRFWELDGWYHNLHVEPEHDMFRAQVAQWMLDRAGPVDAPGAAAGSGPRL